MSRIRQFSQRLRRRSLTSASLLLISTLTLTPAMLLAQASTPGEQRAVRAFDAARADKANALALEALLVRMPKGGDLHMHLSGAVYAETFLKEAAADNLCVNPKAMSLAKNAGTTCPEGNVPAASVLQNQKLYDALVDAFSMRGFVPSAGVSGHDQFFATFDRFGALDKSHAEAVEGGDARGRAERAVPRGDADAEFLRAGPSVELAGLAGDTSGRKNRSRGRYDGDFSR